jgi:tryptophanyl-tRNA synthetase
MLNFSKKAKICSHAKHLFGAGARILTGVRPTGDLTVANYLGAIKPIIELQNQGHSPMVFVADMHAMTDIEPAIARKFIREVVADYIALGIDPNKTKIFMQSDIENETALLTLFLSRLITATELLRVPALKDKLKISVRPETANTLLLLYPVMMAADILLQRAEKVSVGKDQLSHLEVSRELARRFNKRYGKVFSAPQPFQIKTVQILSLKGDGKMSKTSPSGTIFLTDDMEIVAQKIKGAETAFEGKMTKKLESHILLAKSLYKKESEAKEIDALIKEHKKGKQVMGQFKQVFTRVVQSFLNEFQNKKAKIMRNPSYISSVLEKGAQVARLNAQETLRLVKKAMGISARL